MTFTPAIGFITGYLEGSGDLVVAAVKVQEYWVGCRTISGLYHRLLRDDSVLAPIVDHTLTTGGSNERPSKHKRKFSVASLTLGGGGGTANANLDGNPLGAWMNSKVPRKGSDPGAVEEKRGTFMTLGQRSAGLDEDGGGTSSYPGENEAMSRNVDGAGVAEGSHDHRSRMSQGSIRGDNIPKEHRGHSRVEFAENSFSAAGGGALGRRGTDPDLRGPLRTAILAERTFGGSTNSGAGGGGNSDMTMMMNGGGGGGAPGQGGNRGNGLQASDDENRRRPSWASRLGTGFSGFLNRTDSSKSTSGTSQVAYDGYNNDRHVFHGHNSNINNSNIAGDLDVDGLVTPWWSRAGGEWTSTDISSSGPTERQNKRLMMHQPPFVGASEIVEDREGESESSVQDRQTAAAATTTPLQVKSTALEEPSLVDGVDASGAAAGGTTAGYDSSNQSVRRGSTASGRVGDSLPPPILSLDPPSGPASAHAQSLHSQQGSIRSIARSTQPAPEDGNDYDSEDLYDPEFGIGGNGRRRRRNHTKLPSHLLPTQGSQTIIPSAAVISAAAAAVSAGWSESDALAAAMATPGFTPTPNSASGSWMTTTTPGISSDCSSLRNNRTRHNSRTSTTSSLQASLYPRRGSAGEGYMSSEGSSNSVCSNQGALAASGSATSILANSGAPGSGRYRRRAFNNRIIMSPITTTSGKQQQHQ
ncbi:hypothetical protein KI688_008601 [Linnemannia hyalina]|uniref:Uncharacterized protein n=1 Tax=Linnemannia hyalina TaxID=64524 RepID=A0A9P7Y2F7_9FUNG|nr:hypothetical protein KI688_008601 [Linnemannia hyalina]